MTTQNEQDGQKRLNTHPESARIEAHKEAAQLREHTDADDEPAIPAFTADIDETPAFVRYGSAILLGLAFGVGCYIWSIGGVPSAPQNPDHTVKMAPTEQYFTATGQHYDPYMSPFEPNLDVNYTTVGANLRDAALAESVEPLAPGDYSTQPLTSDMIAKNAAVDPETVVYLFETDSADVPETTELTAIAKHATKTGMCLDVRAYTDETGRPAYNQKLSERRANAIADYLIAHGVPASKISVHPMGPTHAFADNAQDRRAEVIEIAE